MTARVLILLFFFTSLCLIAGDTAEFCSIGWSKDNNYYAFAQYGEQDGSGFPYAELYIIDIKENDFVAGGVFKELWQDNDDPAAKGLNVLLELRVKADSLLNVYQIDAAHQVTPIFNAKTDSTEKAKWHVGEDEFAVELEQETRGKTEMFESEAAFALALTPGHEKSITIGNKSRFRKNVLRYDINRILQARDNKSIVIVIRMTQLGFEGPDIRYMVETIKLP